MSELQEKKYYLKPKKFVFHVNPENVDYIEKLSFQQKHDLINFLLLEYKKKLNQNYQNKEKQKQIIKWVAISLLIIFAIPTSIMLVNLSIKLTHSNYNEMRNNFQKLYTEKSTNYKKHSYY